MTKTSKIKLIVSSVLALGATGAVGGTYAALTLTGGDATEDLQNGISIDAVDISNQVIKLGIAVTEGTGTLNVDGAESEGEKTGGIVTADELNDRKFSLDLSVTGYPDAWSYITVTFKWSNENVATYLNKPGDIKIEKGDSNWQTSGSDATTVKSMTKEDIEITWVTPAYQGGFLNWVNSQYASDSDGAWSAMQAFQTAVNGAKLTATVTVTMTSGAGA